jgi:hypothetical protein
MTLSQTVSTAINTAVTDALSQSVSSILPSASSPDASVVNQSLDITVEDGYGGSVTLLGSVSMSGDSQNVNYDYNLTVTFDNYTSGGVKLNGGPLKYSFKGKQSVDTDTMTMQYIQTMNGTITITGTAGTKTIKYNGSAEVNASYSDSSITIKIIYDGSVNINGKQIDYNKETYTYSQSYKF